MRIPKNTPKPEISSGSVIISGETEGINSILKFLKYKKEETKTDAAAKLSSGTRALATDAVSAPTPEALAAMNRSNG